MSHRGTITCYGNRGEVTDIIPVEIEEPEADVARRVLADRENGGAVGDQIFDLTILADRFDFHAEAVRLADAKKIGRAEAMRALEARTTWGWPAPPKTIDVNDPIVRQKLHVVATRRIEASRGTAKPLDISAALKEICIELAAGETIEGVNGGGTR